MGLKNMTLNAIAPAMLYKDSLSLSLSVVGILSVVWCGVSVLKNKKDMLYFFFHKIQMVGFENQQKETR